MKIALVAPLVTPIREPQPGGSQSFIADLAMGLSARGHDVDVYAATDSWIPGVSVIDLEIDSNPLTDTIYRAGSAAASSSAAAKRAFGRVYAALRESRTTWFTTTHSMLPLSSLPRPYRPQWFTPSICRRTAAWWRP